MEGKIYLREIKLRKDLYFEILFGPFNVRSDHRVGGNKCVRFKV